MIDAFLLGFTVGIREDYSYQSPLWNLDVGVDPTHTSTETAFAALVAGTVAAAYTVGVTYLLAPAVLQRLYGIDGGQR